MDRSAFLIELDEILDLEEGTLQGTEILEEIEEWDSLAVISFIALADDKFDIVIEGETLLKAQTVNDLLGLVQHHLAA